MVSFVMAVWAPERAWLRQAVNSVLQQRDCDLELIAVDDGNDRPVDELLTGIDDRRVHVLHVEHGGQCRARNAGIAKARGRYIRFIDADDVLTRDSTSRLLAMLSGREDLIAYGATTFCDAELRPVWTMHANVAGPALEDCLMGRFTVRPFSLLFPRAVVEETGKWDPRLQVSEDWDFVLRALEHAEAIGMREVATWYRKHPGSATGSMTAGERGGRLVLDKYFMRHPDQRGTTLEQHARARLEAQLARAHLTRHDWRKAMRSTQASLRLNPRALLEEGAHAFPAVVGRARSTVIRPEPVAA